MKIELTHRFDHPIDQVWAMLSDPESHVAKFSGMGHRDLEVLSSEQTEDTFDLTLRRLVDIDVPSVAAKVIQPTNTVTSTDHWERTGPDALSGRYEVDIKGVPAQTAGRTEVRADGEGCTYRVEVEVKVKIPVVGERIAKALRPQLEDQIRAEFAACDAWLAER